MPAPWPSSGFSSKASIATRQKSWRPAPESWQKCCSGWFGNWTSELENWSQARPPTAIATPIAISAAASGDAASARVGLRESSTARPVSAPSRRLEPAQAGEERQRERDAREQDQQHRQRPGRRPPGAARLSARLRRACTASTAGSAPSAADRQRRQQPEPVAGEGDQAAAGDQQREQAAARVGEVEGQQHRRQRGDREPSAEPPAASAGSSRAAAPRRSRKRPRSRSSSRAGSAAAARSRARRRPRARGAGGGSPGPEERRARRQLRCLQRNVGAFGRFGR